MSAKSRLSKLARIAGALCCAAQFAYPANPGSIELHVRPDFAPPGDITGLAASTGSETGEIKLSWVAPGDDGTTERLSADAYLIRYDTRPVTDFANDTTAWWDNSGLLYSDASWIPAFPGEEDTKIIQGLNPGGTYYFAVQTRDKANRWSAVSNVVSARAQWDKIAPAAITNLAAVPGVENGELKLSWTAPGDDGTSGDIVNGKFRIGYSTMSGLESPSYIMLSTSINAGSGQSWIVTGLENYTAYYFRVLTADEYPNWSGFSNTATGMTLDDVAPSAPQGLTALIDDGKIKLAWTQNPETDVREYVIYRKTWVEFEELDRVTYPVVEYQDDDVSAGVKYTYYLTAEDNTGNVSVAGNEISIIYGELVKYSDIDIIKITQISSENMIFEWTAVEDSSGYLKGYSIERAGDLAGVWTATAFVYSTQTLSCSVPLGSVYYYRVRTVSVYDVKSDGLLAVDTSDDLNHIYMSAEGNGWVMASDSFINELYAENNGGSPVNIKFNKEENGGFLLSYNIKAEIEDTAVDNFIFKKTRKGAKIVFSYTGAAGSGVMRSASLTPARTAGQQLVLYRHNGVEWVRLGGVSEAAGTRIYTISRRLGRYGIKFAALAAEFTLNRVVPKIFTPEESNTVINSVRFYFENPNFAEVSIGIFDITGAKIRSNLRREGENVMVWDGRNDGGEIVRGGIYIYQIEADGKIINGTIVAAK